MLRDYQAALDGVALFDLSHHGRVLLTGPDAGEFLHNLCTQDVKNLPVGAGAETFFCTATARIVAHGVVNHLTEETWLVDSDVGQGEILAKHLDHYLISEQVEIQDATPTWAQLRLIGPFACNLFEKTLGVSLSGLADLYQQNLTIENHAAYVRRQDFLVLPSWDVLCLTGTASGLSKRLQDAGAATGGTEVHEILRVEAGWPVFGHELDNTRFVVETGRIQQAISYTKGCYLGQEPIVMARDRGQVNRSLLGICFSEGPLPTPGIKLFHGNQEAGQVTSVAQSLRFGPIGLAFLRRGHETPGTMVTAEQQGQRVQGVLTALPFA